MSTIKTILLASTFSMVAMTGMANASDLNCTVAGGDDITMNNIEILRTNQPVVTIDGSYKTPILGNIYRIDSVDGKDISETPTFLSYNHYPSADHKLAATIQVYGQDAVRGNCIVTEQM